MLNIIFIASSFLFMMAMLKSLFEINAFLKQLEKEHLSEYEALGRPRWRVHFGDTSYRDTVKKIRSHGFVSLNDAILENCYKAMKRADRTAIITAVIAFGITLFQAVMS